MKKTFIIMALAICSQSVKAQEFYHSIGAAFNIGRYQLTTSDLSTPDYNSIAALPAIVYRATLAFEISRSSYFGVTAYPGVGGYFNNQTGGYGGFQLPLMAEMYFGDIEGPNFNIGAGFALNGIFDTDAGGGLINGPQLAIGGEFELRERLYGLRAYFTPGFKYKEGKDFAKGSVVTENSKMLFGVGIVTRIGY